MANRTTPTQRNFYNDIIALATASNRPDIVEFAKSRIDALDKKAGKVDAKHTAEVDANVELVYTALANTNGNLTVSELVKVADNGISEWSGQKVSAYLKKLVDAKRVIKTTDKKVSRFTVA